MSIIRSIVVHVSDNEQHTVRLRTAVDLARHFEAHLNVVFAKPDADYPAAAIGRAMSMQYLEEVRREAEARLEKVEGDVERICSSLTSWERHEQFGDAAEIMSYFAHVSDLVVVEQPAPDHPEDGFMRDMSDQLLMSAGCPMLLLPAAWSGTAFGKRVLVAWKNSREASLAVRGSLDFLERADEVLILAGEDSRLDKPGDDVIAYLGHHGIRAKVVGTSAGDGSDFLKAVDRHRCDLLVMGAYAHSRLRELFLGGATAHVMRHTTIPVLMRH